MAFQAFMYNHTPKIFLDWTVDFLNDTIKVALLTNAYTPGLGHQQWSEVSAHELGDASYSQLNLAGKFIDEGKMDADNPLWSNLSGTFRYAVVYASASRNGLVDPLIYYILLDDTPADVTVSNEDYEIPFDPAGIFTFN